jgi:hypothetical protein
LSLLLKCEFFTTDYIDYKPIKNLGTPSLTRKCEIVGILCIFLYYFSFENCQLFYSFYVTLSALIFSTLFSSKTLAWILRRTRPFQKMCQWIKMAVSCKPFIQSWFWQWIWTDSSEQYRMREQALRGWKRGSGGAQLGDESPPVRLVWSG